MKRFLILLLCIAFVLSGCSTGERQKEKQLICTLSISCRTLVDSAVLATEKQELVPADGWLLAPVECSFSEGESVFDVLYRITRENKIHMEYVQTLAYNSVYIEGIGNLYEFDGGAQSGWMYAVNGEFPNYGCSGVQLKDGDVVEWMYTCDLGADIGGGMAS